MLLTSTRHIAPIFYFNCKHGNEKNSLLQKRANNAKTASHTDPFFFKYKILKLNDLTECNQAIFIIH